MNDKQQKEQQLEYLMDQYGDIVLRTAYFYMKDFASAEDIYQEVFLKVHKNMANYRGDSSVKTWILQITINQCKDQLKSAWLRRVVFKSKPENFVSRKELQEYIYPEKLVLENEEKVELLIQVMKLSIPFREVVILHYYHDFNIQEISSILDIAVGTVKSRLSRARNTLKYML